MKLEQIKMWRVYDPDERKFINSLWLVTMEFDEQAYLDSYPCPCGSEGRNLKYHKFIKQPSGIFWRCNIQRTAQGVIPTIDKGKPYPWITILKKKEISKAQARKLFVTQKSKFVATPDIILFLR